MNTVFLDIDGVCNSFGDIYRDGSDAICRTNIACINHILTQVDAQFVISSDWRKWHTLNWIDKHLKLHGFQGNIIDKTDDNRLWTDGFDADGNFDRWVYDILPRGLVIRNWVTKNNCTNFVIIDDNDVGADMDCHLIRTNPDIGFTMKDAQKVIDKLK